MNVVVFGAGYWGTNYIRELAGNLVAVVEPDKLRADVAKQLYNVRVFPELPDDLEFDGAVIVTPPQTHIKIAKPLLERGKYVLIEKPLAQSSTEAYTIAGYRDRCMAGLVYLYHPEVERLRHVYLNASIDHGFSRRTNQGPVREWGNAMWDLAPHDISIFNYIAGSSTIGVEATVAYHWAAVRLLYIAFEALIYVSWIGGPKTRTVELVPTVGGGDRVVFDDVKMSAAMTRSPLRLMLDDFLSSKWKAESSFEAGLDVVSTLEACSGNVIQTRGGEAHGPA